MPFNAFLWSSRGGFARRALLNQKRKQALDQIQPDVDRAAQAVADHAQQTAARIPVNRWASRGAASPFQQGARVAANQTLHRNQRIARAQVPIAKAFEPEPDVTERTRSIFRAKVGGRNPADQIERDRLQRGGEKATAFRGRISSLQDAAGTTALARNAEQNKTYLEDKYPGMLPSEALKAELEAGDSLLEPGLQASQAQAMQEIDPNHLGDKVFDQTYGRSTESLLPDQVTEPIGSIPVVGERAQAATEFATSPVGLALTAIDPAAMAAGSIGSVAAGSAAEAAGAPPEVQMGAEVLGGLLPGAAVSKPARFLRRGVQSEAEMLPSQALKQRLEQETAQLPSEELKARLNPTAIEDAGPTVAEGAQGPGASTSVPEAEVDSAASVAPADVDSGASPISTGEAEAQAESPLNVTGEASPTIDEDVFGGEAVGAAQAARAPGIRAVEQADLPKSVPSRRALAEAHLSALSDDAAPRTVEQYAQENGDEFVDSIFDPIFNAQRRSQDKNTKLIKDTRRVAVVRDIYREREGGRIRDKMVNWIARNADVLGIDVNKGTLKNVELAPSAKIPEGWARNPQHIAAHPESYVLTPEQQKAWDEMQTIQKDWLISNEQRHGIDVAAVEGDYWPMPVIKAPPGAQGEVYRPLTQQNMSTQPWFTKLRSDADPFTAKGFKYANPFDALLMRSDSSVDAISNRWAIDSLKAKGYKPSERIGKDIIQEYRDAKEAYKQAKPLFQSGDQADRQAYEAARDRLAATNAEVRRQTKLVNQAKPQMFGRIVAPEVAEEFTRYIAKSDPSKWDDILRSYRTIMVNGDYGSPMLQNYALITNNPVGWLKSFALGASSFVKAPMGYWAKQNPEMLGKAIRLGLVSAPEELMLSEGGSLSQRIGRLPLIKQSQRAFTENVRIGQWERAKAIMDTVTDEKELRAIASVWQKQGGILFSPGMTASKAKLMSNLWFAPQWTAAMNAMLLDPLVKTGAARRQALKSVSRMVGGAAAFTVGANMALNDGKLPNMDDPNSDGFWGVHLPDGTYVYPFGPLQPTLKLMAQQAKGVSNVVQGEAYGKENILGVPKFVESKLGLGPRWFLAAVEAMGAPISSIRGPAYSDPNKKLSFDKMFQRAKSGDVPGAILQGTDQGIFPLPIGAAQAAKAVKRGAPFGTLESGGVRTTLPPTFASKAWNLRNEMEKLPRYKGLDPEDEQKVADFRSTVTADRSAWMDEHPGEDAASLSAWLKRNAGDLGDPVLEQWATASENQLANAQQDSERTRFILLHWDELSKAYPSLTEARWLKELRARGGRAAR